MEQAKGSLSIEERLCVCGAVQTEMHVVEVCPFLLILDTALIWIVWRTFLMTNRILNEVVE